MSMAEGKRRMYQVEVREVARKLDSMREGIISSPIDVERKVEFLQELYRHAAGVEEGAWRCAFLGVGSRSDALLMSSVLLDIRRDLEDLNRSSRKDLLSGLKKVAEDALVTTGVVFAAPVVVISSFFKGVREGLKG